MDSHTVGALGRLEVVETGRRRRWSEDEKLKIVLESLAGSRLVSATARRHGISRSLLLTWRRAFRVERTEVGSGSCFVPAVMVPEPPPAPAPKPDPRAPRPREGRIEGCPELLSELLLTGIRLGFVRQARRGSVVG